MKIILGQGNPGTQYAGSRHNIGFHILDSYAQRHDLGFQAKPKFKADIAELQTSDDKVLLVKPTTFYNETGQTARALLDFYKLAADDILIVHDELALPFGTIRSRLGGSDAGNNGVKSINQQVGPDTARVRVGIWNQQRDLIDDADFVLSRFNAEEAGKLPVIIDQAGQLIDDFLAGSFEPTTHR
ncbi:MAG TPA: aminoacyl-tRNA hydrolase [Candidatus Saccharimonadales bacterium]|nr:aminoacyl-tRNA hydrolase [Candidatus Saccharimonadales bacterium]